MANEEMIQKHLDNFLAKIAGETPVDDTIQNSTEFWLNEIAEQGGGTEVVANPTLAGTEDPLTGLEVDGTKYKIEQPIDVAANPTLAGTEDPLTGIEVDGTKYKVNQPIDVEGNPAGVGGGSALTGLKIGNSVFKVRDGSTNGLGYLTTAPTAANTDGIKIVVLSSEPATKYNGYLYIILA